MVTTRKVLLPGDSTKDGLRVGGASEVLRDANGAIYLSWSNHIHRLAFDSTKQSVTIQRFVRKLRYSTSPAKYTCLVWPCQMKGYQEVQATFNYPVSHWSIRKQGRSEGKTDAGVERRGKVEFQLPRPIDCRRRRRLDFLVAILAHSIYPHSIRQRFDHGPRCRTQRGTIQPI